MIRLLIDLPYLNPIAFSFGALQVHWYGIMYLLSFVIVYWYLRRSHLLQLTKTQIQDLLFTVGISLLVGARIGYILFYNLNFYIANPAKIIAVWEGGMSFHGGFIGAVIGLIIFWSYHKKAFTFFEITDTLVGILPLTLALGRVGNFINGELYGRLSTAPWAVRYFGTGDYRHPSQLYEAFLEIALLVLLLSPSIQKLSPGKKSALFIVGYAIIRLFVECFREPDSQIGFIFAQITLGQLLTLPMLILGIVFWFYHTHDSKNSV